jgi:hypothetical protein
VAALRIYTSARQELLDSLADLGLCGITNSQNCKILQDIIYGSTNEPLAILPLSFVGFASMPSDPQIIDTDGPTSHRHGMA